MQPYFSSCLVIRSVRPLRSEQPASVLEIEQRLVCPKCCESVATLPAFWRVSLCTILDIKLIYNSSHVRNFGLTGDTDHQWHHDDEAYLKEHGGTEDRADH